MQQRRLGQSGLKVSRLGLGTLTWGHDVPWSVARSLTRAFVEAGGNLIDTAPAYGSGVAEKMIGKLIHTDIRRDELVIASKAGFVVKNGKRVVDTSRASLLADLEATLRRLHTDHLDIWQVHAWGDAPLEETLSALDTAISRGMTRYVGLSNYIGWQTAEAATWQRAVPGRNPISSIQVEYSLLARRAEVEVIGAAQHLGLGLISWSPLGRGVLSGKYRAGIPRDSRGASNHFSWFIEPYLEQRSKSVVEAVAKAANGLSLTAAQVALLWVRDCPIVASCLVGPRTLEQLTPLLNTEDLTLPNEIISALDDVSGGPNVYR